MRPLKPLDGRRSLANFIRAELSRAYPRPIDTLPLAEKAATQFGLRLAPRAQCQLFRNRQRCYEAVILAAKVADFRGQPSENRPFTEEKL